MTQFLKVPGEWLAACGYGSEERTFPVLRVKNLGHGRTFVTIDRDGHSWEVWAEMRDAILLTVPDEAASYFYTPLPAYPHILKCQGICTPDNRDWFVAQHPGTIVVEGYQGDRITREGE